MGDKPKKEVYVVEGEEKTDKPELKNTIAKVIDQGWEVEDKIVRPSKVIIYVWLLYYLF